jgi:hypothetical protein
MARFAAQVLSAGQAHDAVNALEAYARQQIASLFDSWDAGHLDDRTVRYALEKVIRDAYRGSVALAIEHVRRQTEDLVPGWSPQQRVFVTPYLTSLVSDVRRNLRAYKVLRTDKARRTAVLRMMHSAGVAAQRGYTDSLVSAYGEMKDMGLTLRKYWVANFVGHTPCPQCQRLHGTEVGLDESFPIDGFPVYLDLTGPPAHPHCQCHLAVIVVTLENVFDKVDLAKPTQATENKSMSAARVRAMPAQIFTGFIGFVRKALAKIRGK